MAPLVSTIEIARPQDEVFSYVTDPTTFAEWQEGVVGGSVAAGNTPAVGSKCTTTRRIGGSERPSTSEITKLDPPTSWAVHGIDGPIGVDRSNEVRRLVELSGVGRRRAVGRIAVDGDGGDHGGFKQSAPGI